MCGICGIYSAKPINKKISQAFEKILLRTESRGRDSFGYYTYPNGNLFRVAQSVSNYTRYNLHQDYSANSIAPEFEGYTCVAGHCRLATQGPKEKIYNNHPFETEDFVLSHNGIIRNDESLKKKFGFNYETETDSYIIIHLIQHFYNKNKSVVKSIQETTKLISGVYACWLIHKETGKLYLFRHSNPIIVGYVPSEELFLFASEKRFFTFLEEELEPKDYGKFKRKIFYSEVSSEKIYCISFDEGIKKYAFETYVYSADTQVTPRRAYSSRAVHQSYNQIPAITFRKKEKVRNMEELIEEYSEIFDQDLLKILDWNGFYFVVNTSTKKVEIDLTDLCQADLDSLQKRGFGLSESKHDDRKIIRLREKGLDTFIKAITDLNITGSMQDETSISLSEDFEAQEGLVAAVESATGVQMADEFREED